jgi:hypothetical protein
VKHSRPFVAAVKAVIFLILAVLLGITLALPNS